MLVKPTSWKTQKDCCWLKSLFAKNHLFSYLSGMVGSAVIRNSQNKMWPSFSRYTKTKCLDGGTHGICNFFGPLWTIIAQFFSTQHEHHFHQNKQFPTKIDFFFRKMHDFCVHSEIPPCDWIFSTVLHVTNIMYTWLEEKWPTFCGYHWETEIHCSAFSQTQLNLRLNLKKLIYQKSWEKGGCYRYLTNKQPFTLN